MTLPIANYYYMPNHFARIIYQSMEDVLGRASILTALNAANVCLFNHLHLPPYIEKRANQEKQVSFNEINRIQKAIEEMYGEKSASGLAVRTGRACFHRSLREFGPLLGISDLSFRLQPLPRRVRSGFERLELLFDRYSEQAIRIEEKPDRYILQVEACPVCWGRVSSGPICHLTVGVLQEALYWVSSGRQFRVIETCCSAAGDPNCSFEINKLPIE
jgi:predicted hydrocarbon binding protein